MSAAFSAPSDGRGLAVESPAVDDAMARSSIDGRGASTLRAFLYKSRSFDVRCASRLGGSCVGDQVLRGLAVASERSA